MPPSPYPGYQASTAGSPAAASSAGEANPARQHSEPLRELGAWALLAGNGVFLLLGVSGLFFVIDNWGSEFGLRSAAMFPRFLGPLALALPMLALLLATHVRPMLRHGRALLIVVLAEYGCSAFFGAITFLGAFAYDLRSARATIEGLLERCVWLGLFVLACITAVRVWLGLFPARPAAYRGNYRPTYGKPYPGQPIIPPPAQYPTVESPTVAVPQEAPANGWPVVPPPPQPQPLVVDVDPTMRISLPPLEAAGGEATQVVPLPEDR